jgi:hypothetical protein
MLALVIWQNHFASVGVSSKEAMRGMAAKAMCGLRTALAACGVLVLATATAAAEDMAYSVTVTGACKSQLFAGWDDCQGTATYTAFKNGKYNFRFIDKNNNVYVLAGGKDRQLDVSNLYSNIDSMDTTIDGKKAVDSQAMGGCNTKLSPDGEKFVYIDCAVSNSKKASFKFRITNITDVVRAFAP